MGIELVRNFLRSSCRHPLLVFMVFVLFCTHRLFPALFTLLVHASPVIVSTLALLGTLLFYGNANANTPQKERKPPHDVQNLVFGGIGEERYLVNNNMNVNVCKKLTGELGNRRVNRGGEFQGFGSGNVKLRSSDGSRRNSFDVLGHIDDDDTGSDVVEGSSTNGSVADMFPMLDEFHPLLGPEGHLDQGNETEDDLDDEDVESKDYDEDEHSMGWLEDEHMNMGSLEDERNQRLESLIARQKAIKNMAEKNMVNISPDLHAHVSTGRNNQLDLPNHSHENMMPRSGHADKRFDKSNSSTFFDVPDGINGNDDNVNEEQDFGSVDNSTSDSKELQEDSEETESEEEGGLTQRIKAWLFG